MSADSVSRAYAETLPVDTLIITGSILGSDSLMLEYPRTVDFGPDGLLWVSDTQNHILFAFADDLSLTHRIDVARHPYPYLAGFSGDTLLAFSPESMDIVKIFSGSVVSSVDMPGDGPAEGALQYAAGADERLYYKVLAKDFAGYIAEMDLEGNILRRFDLPLPYWRHAGLLRFWGDSLISLSGFRPVIDVISDSSGVDSLSLFGFDSPMLARSRQFLIGDTSSPPLLTASAAAAGNLLFVLNMRPGWLRVDVYNRRGRLQHILTEPLPEFNQEYYPTDIAVRRMDEDTFELAVSVVEPESRIDRFRWRRH